MGQFSLIYLIMEQIFCIFTVYESLGNMPWGVKRGMDGERASTVLYGEEVLAEGGHGSGTEGGLHKEK